LLRQLSFDQQETAVLKVHHALFQLPSTRKALTAGATRFCRFKAGGQVLVLATHTNNSPDTRILGALLQDRWKETLTKQHLAQHLAQQEERIETAENRLIELQNAWKIQLTQILKDWQQAQLPVTVELGPELTEHFLMEFSAERIRAQLEASLALQLFIQPGNSHVYLTQSTLVVPEKAQPDSPPTSLTSHQRVTLLLDKYEEAARAAQRRGIAVSGKTIAGHLQPSISPPAITDALKKNRKAISALIHQHPDKWPLLRKYLKPVKELHERHSFARI
jgi:hypothetical protein